MRGKRILLINPWIHDFAAYDLWAKPLGLLMLGGLLRTRGCQVELMDCLAGDQPPAKPGGRAKYRREIITKPRQLAGIPRYYARYGMDPEKMRAHLKDLGNFDAVLVTSLMTYWYPGVIEAISLVKQCMPHTPVILGGIYASLCQEHACRHSGADYVIAGPGEKPLLELLEKLWNINPRSVLEHTPDNSPYACFDLYESPHYVCVQTSRGCPFRCTYCASHLLAPHPYRRDPRMVAQELVHWHARGIRDFAFYDDALLAGPEAYTHTLLQTIIDQGLQASFHCPNALHAARITEHTARLMREAGFATIRLGLETNQPELQRATGGKVTNRQFIDAVANLRAAGFEAHNIGVYLLCGLPQQRAAEVAEAIAFVQACGTTPLLTEFSPIPGTGLWEEACCCSQYPLRTDPIYQNNTVMACRWEGFTFEDFQELRKIARQGRPQAQS